MIGHMIGTLSIIVFESLNVEWALGKIIQSLAKCTTISRLRLRWIRWDTEVKNIICVNDGQNVVCDNTVDNNQAIDKDGGI